MDIKKSIFLAHFIRWMTSTYKHEQVFVFSHVFSHMWWIKKLRVALVDIAGSHSLARQSIADNIDGDNSKFRCSCRKS